MGLLFAGTTFLTGMLVGVLGLAVGIWALVEASRYSSEQWQAAGHDRTWWLIGIGGSFFLVGPWLGALLYVLIARRDLIAACGPAIRYRHVTQRFDQWVSPPEAPAAGCRGGHGCCGAPDARVEQDTDSGYNPFSRPPGAPQSTPGVHDDIPKTPSPRWEPPVAPADPAATDTTDAPTVDLPTEPDESTVEE